MNKLYFFSELFNLSFLLFVLGLIGIFIYSKNMLITLIFLEIILLSLNILTIIFSFYVDDLVAQLISIILLVIAAIESAIGLTIIYLYSKNNTILIKNFYI